MGVDQRIVRRLNEEGHDAVHLSDQSLHRLRDQDIFSKAHSEGRVILTFDLDFGEIAALAGDRVVSVVVFRLHNTRTAHVIERLSDALTLHEALQQGVVLVVEETRCRVRRLPIRAAE